MAGDYEEYDEWQFKETYGEEKEELSDTESDGGAKEETDGRMSVDHVSPPKKDDDEEDNTGGGTGPSGLPSNGAAISASNESAQTINEPAPENDSGKTNTQGTDASSGNRERREEVLKAFSASAPEFADVPTPPLHQLRTYKSTVQLSSLVNQSNGVKALDVGDIIEYKGNRVVVGIV
jgi:hypothetical protein